MHPWLQDVLDLASGTILKSSGRRCDLFSCPLVYSLPRIRVRQNLTRNPTPENTPVTISWRYEIDSDAIWGKRIEHCSPLASRQRNGVQADWGGVAANFQRCELLLGDEQAPLSHADARASSLESDPLEVRGFLHSTISRMAEKHDLLLLATRVPSRVQQNKRSSRPTPQSSQVHTDTELEVSYLAGGKPLQRDLRF
jgi:hypothetical protein